ncbi:zinc finger protein RFP-like isoform X2 [Heteronotia binoei]|uniref:zinc finger protein RFP-like isoform X2 n=1 Tax=Heteronotia binoei TaxID=13085 RepID=UPI002931A2E3|nr:zinc finger protein RFP-like isoform X2 [Heteronotia binoei]
MAHAALISALCEETTCSICLEPFTEPVILDCGHNFCRACIFECWKESCHAASCPQCRRIILHRDPRPNRQLANIVEIAKKLEERTRAEQGGKRGLCERRWEEEALACEACGGGPEHQDHHLAPVEETALIYTEKILLTLARLNDMFKEFVKEFSEKICHLVRKNEAEFQQVSTKFLQESGSTLHRYEEGQERPVVEFSSGLERQKFLSETFSSARGHRELPSELLWNQTQQIPSSFCPRI